MNADEMDKMIRMISARVQINQAEQAEEIPEKDYNGITKFCPQCGKDLPIRMFIAPKSGAARGYCKPCDQLYQRTYKYGYYDEKPVKCEICGLVFDLDNVARLDHNHKTGVIRGWLCHHCNLLIGNAREDISVLVNSIKYLIKNIPKI